MSNQEFLDRLEAALRGRVPQEEIDDAVRYHREYFAEAGEDAANEIPAPEEVADQIVRERELYLRKRRRQWARPFIIGALCVGILAAFLLTKGFLDLRPWRRGAADIPDELQVVDQVMGGTAEQRPVQHIAPGSFERVVIENVSDNVSVTAGDDFSLYMNHSDRETLEYTVESGVLRITGSFQSVSLRSYEAGCIDITVPEDTHLSYIDVKADLGDVCVNGVSADKMELCTDLGEVRVSNGRADSLKCESDLGNVTVSDVEAHELECKSDFGDVEAVRFRSVDAELETDWGSVNALALGGADGCRLELETELGEIKVNGQKVGEGKASSVYSAGGKDRSLAAKTGAGNVTVEFLDD